MNFMLGVLSSIFVRPMAEKVKRAGTGGVGVESWVETARRCKLVNKH